MEIPREQSTERNFQQSNSIAYYGVVLYLRKAFSFTATVTQSDRFKFAFLHLSECCVLQQYNAAIPCRHRRSLSSPITLYETLGTFCSVLRQDDRQCLTKNLMKAFSFTATVTQSDRFKFGILHRSECCVLLQYNAAIPCRHRRSLSSPIAVYETLFSLNFCSVLKTRRSTVSDKTIDAILNTGTVKFENFK
ncbi:hypothetical protein CEXT_616761 [Caerostris extrusa]|uniref:SWIM-type domain-containing protein n=1 Tax=Caerostris extrusa TaxID=172846 RepID=A0AAV4MLJ4_CAEEX|nr:hypothetical protein CEXT_616761 [Caerostris extrusa]